MGCAGGKKGVRVAILAVALAAAGCGTSHVRMMVVRPALINARLYGGTVSVGGMAAAHPDWILLAGQMRTGLQQEILAGYGGVVQLREVGGGLTITGRLLEHGIVLTERSRETTCQDRVEVRQGEVTATRTLARACTLRRHHWTARVTVLTRVTASDGRILYLRRVIEAGSGDTAERRGSAPMPDSHRILQRLRRRVIRRMARIVVPHRVRVTATLYDCEPPAEAICRAGVAHLARSRYDAAIADYDRALAALRDAKGVSRADLGKLHWNKAVVFKYSRRFQRALGELDAALALDPGNGTYARERRAVLRDRDRHVRLIEQGLGPTGP